MAKSKKNVEEEIAIAMGVEEKDPLFPDGLLGEVTLNVEDEEENEEDKNEGKEVEEENNEEEIHEEENSGNEPPVGDENSTIKILTNWLRDEGIVDFKDEDFKDSEDFIEELIVNRIDAGIESYKEELPKVIKDLIDNYEEGVPLAELLGVKVNNENYLTIKSEDLTASETKQKQVVREYYKRLGWKEEKISAKIEKLESRAELEDESIELLEELQEILKEEEEEYKEQQKNLEKQKQQQYEAAKAEFKSVLDKKEEIFAGLKLTQKQKDILFNGIWVADKNGENELIKKIKGDPEYNLKVAYMTLVLNWDLSALDKIAATKASKGLRDAIEGSKNVLKGNSANVNQTSNGKIDFSVIERAAGKK